MKSVYFCIFSQIFLYFKRPGRILGSTQPPIWCAPTIVLGVKRPERGSNHLLPFSATVKNECSYTYTLSIYRVSQEEWTKVRESVPYVELYRYDPKHLYPKLNGYGDNGLRKVWTSCISAYCTSTAVVHWHWQCNKNSHLCNCTRSAQRDKTVLHYGQIFMRNV